MDRVNILFSMRTPGLLSLCLVAAIFANFFLYGSVATCFKCGDMCHKSLLYFFCSVKQWENFLNPSIFGEDMNKSSKLNFFWPILYDNIVFYYKFSTECAGEKNSKIGQYLAKIWTKVCSLLFWGPPCMWTTMCIVQRLTISWQN